MARPKLWEKETRERAIELILKEISDGKSVRAIFREVRDSDVLPSRKTFKEWLCDDESLSAQYAYACEERADGIFEDILNIADSGENDTTTDQEGNVKINNEVIQRDRLRVDARKWVLSKMNPTRFSDRIQTEISGPNGSPLVINVIPDE